MAKKSIDSKHQAFAHKGAKAPKPGSKEKGEVKASHLKPHKGKQPEQGKKADEMKSAAQDKMHLPSKGSAHKKAEAGSQFSGLNGGKSHSCEHLQGHDVKSKK